MSVRTPAAARVSVEARLGSKVLGRAARTATGAIAVKLDAKRLRSARRGATLAIRIQATGTDLTAVTQTAKVKLKT